MNNYQRVRAQLAAATPVFEIGDEGDWQSLWSAVAARLTQLLASNDLAGFDAVFDVIAEALNICEAPGRQAAMPLLFGEFTRRAIGAGFDRTRFVKWLGPRDILIASPGRMRGRVLYFSNAKGRGKILGSDGVVHFCHYSQFLGTGYRSIHSGELVEFTSQFGSFNGGEGFGAFIIDCVSESEPDREAARRSQPGRGVDMDFPERDWRHLRALHRAALDRYCTRVLEEIGTVLADEKSSAHDRYLRLFRVLQERDRAMAVAFDDLRRSRAIPCLAAMMGLGVVTDEDLNAFSAQTRDAALLLEDLSRPHRTSRRS